MVKVKTNIVKNVVYLLKFFCIFILFSLSACINAPEDSVILSKDQYMCKEIGREIVEGRYGTKLYKIHHKCIFINTVTEEYNTRVKQDNLNKILNEN